MTQNFNFSFVSIPFSQEEQDLVIPNHTRVVSDSPLPQRYSSEFPWPCLDVIFTFLVLPLSHAKFLKHLLSASIEQKFRVLPNLELPGTGKELQYPKTIWRSFSLYGVCTVSFDYLCDKQKKLLVIYVFSKEFLLLLN